MAVYDGMISGFSDVAWEQLHVEAAFPLFLLQHALGLSDLQMGYARLWQKCFSADDGEGVERGLFSSRNLKRWKVWR
jgi:hypothetical protein